MLRYLLFLIVVVIAGCGSPDAYRHSDGAYCIDSPDGTRTLRVTFYGDAIVRLQTAFDGEAFFPDDHYEMVASHEWPRETTVLESDDQLVFKTGALHVSVDRETLATGFFFDTDKPPVLHEVAGVARDGTRIGVEFIGHGSERFTGLGHGYFGRADSVELTGQVVERNYGNVPIEQAPLIVPFYLSSFGYGVFLNSTFPNRFVLAANGEYAMLIDTHGFDGQMDYFFIAGPKLTDVLDRYTQLTGRPRLPPKSIFGLQLSDKGHDHNSPTPSDEDWWKDRITAHREAGLPLDHVVNDNRWRAAGGKRCESRIEWDEERYPDPAEWAEWLRTHGLTSTIDFNRCIARFSDGWQTGFNLPPIDNIEFADSAPDMTNADFRRWFWNLFYEKSLDPALGYPGDGLWIDEFDEQGAAPKNIVLANGRSSAEMRNYWFFLVAKALVADGWDPSGIDQRPYVWVRGMTAGAQRYATLWTGDIKPNNEDFEAQVRAMQLAGLAGFAFWGHDAGGFFDWDAGVGPDDSLYRRWAMGFGSFAPIWKPHGMGESRWPLDRSDAEREATHEFARLRYELMPYLYSLAHEAADTGMPIARPLLIEYPDVDEAWERDLQYLWGPGFLVAPNTTESPSVDVWLPTGAWFRHDTGEYLAGNQVVRSNATLPLFVRAGAVVPRRDYVLSTMFIDKTRLLIDVYTGADGTFRLVEDDDRTEAWRQGARVLTALQYDDASKVLTIGAGQGSYPGAPAERRVMVRVIEPGAVRTIELGKLGTDRRHVIDLSARD